MASIKIKFHDNTDKVFKSVHEAARTGGNITMQTCVLATKEDLPVASGRLYDSKKFQAMQDVEPGLVGQWGTFDSKIDYAAWIETGRLEDYAKITAPMPEEETQINEGNRYQQVMAAEKYYPDFVGIMKEHYR